MKASRNFIVNGRVNAHTFASLLREMEERGFRFRSTSDALNEIVEVLSSQLHSAPFDCTEQALEWMDANGFRGTRQILNKRNGAIRATLARESIEEIQRPQQARKERSFLTDTSRPAFRPTTENESERSSQRVTDALPPLSAESVALFLEMHPDATQEERETLGIDPRPDESESESYLLALRSRSTTPRNLIGLSEGPALYILKKGQALLAELESKGLANDALWDAICALPSTLDRKSAQAAWVHFPTPSRCPSK